jgi:hypothetical protein
VVGLFVALLLLGTAARSASGRQEEGSERHEGQEWRHLPHEGKLPSERARGFARPSENTPSRSLVNDASSGARRLPDCHHTFWT